MAVRGNMTDYDLNRLGEKEFEHLAQALIKNIIGVGTITFGDGPDGGREATYSGKAPYPSDSEQWDGQWIFQAKYHDLNAIGHDAARKQILLDLRSELEKISEKYERDCRNYILITNVHLSSVDKKGTHDKISEKILPDFQDRIPNIHVWGYDDICRFLDSFADIRHSYLHFITPGDILAELMDHKIGKKHLAETLRLYIRTSIDRDESAKLDQAGQIDEKPLPLRKVFIDLDVKPRNTVDLKVFQENNSGSIDKLRSIGQDDPISAAQLLINSPISKVVIIGGPGQGKSTLTQFIAQIHRAYILQTFDEFNGDCENFTPNLVRIPFRVLLKDYAQWMVDNKNQLPYTLEKFISKLIKDDSGGREISVEDVQDIFAHNPILLILDGLDEVTDSNLRLKMLEQLSQFIFRTEDVLKADLQILATSRPTGYSDQFDPSHFLHLSLVSMNRDKILEYTKKWIKAKEFDFTKGHNLESSIIDCLDEPNFSSLMNTPLQVTIFIFIILNGGTPPRQREELFEDYLEIIYKRERAKSKTIIQTEKRLLLGLHQYLGYILHKRAGASADTRSMIREDEFKREVFAYLRHNDQLSDRMDLMQKANLLIKEAHERLVLLVKLEPEYFGFELRSIQEFFAAGYLNDTSFNSEQRFKRFRATAIPPHWHNVALFFAGRVGRCHPGETAYILEACRDIDRNKPDSFLKRGAWFALEIAIDHSFEPNRMLQRSAIEYSLTLLGSDLNLQKKHNLISRLSELSKDDIDHHVIPLLSERLKKSRFIDDFSTLDIFHAISKNSLIIEDTLNNAIEMGDVTQKVLLEKAIQYELSPKYIESKFTKVFSNLNEDDIVDLFFSEIYSPEYFAEIWRHSINRPYSMAISIFYIFLDLASFIMPTEKIKELLLKKDLIGQVISAFQIFIYVKGLTPQFREKMNLWMRNDVDISNPLDIAKEMAEVVSNTSAIIELKAAALAILYRLHLYRSDEQNFFKLIPQFIPYLNLKEKENVDQIFFHAGVPSIEKIEIKSLVAKSNFSNQHIHNSQQYISSLELDLKSENSIQFFILDPLNNAQINEVIGCELDLLEQSQKNLLTNVRLRSMTLSFEKNNTIDSNFAARALNVITNILRDKSSEEWRAWAALSRLVSFSLINIKIDYENAFEKFLDYIELNINQIQNRESLCVLMTRIAEINMNNVHIIRFLHILSKILPFNNITAIKYQIMNRRQLTNSIVKRIFDTLASSDANALDGFLKWLDLAGKDISNSPNERMSHPLSFDFNNIRSVFEEGNGSTCNGALMLISISSSINYEQLKQILELSKKDSMPTDLDWRLLFERVIENVDQDKLMDFLENILSPGTKYPKSIIHLAFDKYAEIIKNMNIDISDVELGLPFHDNI